MSSCNFIFPYTGRKKKFENDIVYKHIQLQNITTIVEPFGGSMSFSQYLHLYHGHYFKYIYNDTYKNMCNFMTYINKNGIDGLDKLCKISNEYEPKHNKSVRNEIKTVQDFLTLNRWVKIRHS